MHGHIQVFLHLSKLCDIAIFKPICDIIERFGDDHLPVDNIDNDYFSDVQTFQGTSWRGKDCDDADSSVYPGHYTTEDALLDTNCNGIYGMQGTLTAGRLTRHSGAMEQGKWEQLF